MNQWKSAHAVEDQGAHTGAGIRRRRRGLRPVTEGRLHHRHGEVDGGQTDHLRDGQPRSGNHRRGGRRGALRRHHGDRPFGLSEPGQQRPRLPVSVSRRARCARQRDQYGDEDRGRAGARRARARGCAGRSRRGLRHAAEVRAGLHHSDAVRPAAHFLCAARGRQGRDGNRRRAQTDRRHGGVPAGVAHATRPGRGRARARA